jgi:hypothetical protein
MNHPLTRNMGAVDRLLRFWLGVAMIVSAFVPRVAETGYHWIGWFGLIAVVTSLSATCPLYGLAGLNTCPRRA